MGHHDTDSVLSVCEGAGHADGPRRFDWQHGLARQPGQDRRDRGPRLSGGLARPGQPLRSARAVRGSALNAVTNLLQVSSYDLITLMLPTEPGSQRQPRALAPAPLTSRSLAREAHHSLFLRAGHAR